MLKFVFIAVFSFGFLLLLAYSSFSHLSALKYVNPGRTALMLERGGRVEQEWLPLSKIARHLQRAVVEAEDGNFYRHSGVDFEEVRASFRKNMKKRRFARGFSTITMQVAKNLYLTPQKTITRKILEVLIAIKMERSLSKDRILEIYLNIVEWGKGVYGAEAAARHYFKKSAAALTIDESAFLASILPNPRKWGRWPPGPYVQKRKGVILARMGFWGPPKKKEEIEVPELPEELPGEPVEEIPTGLQTEPVPETLPVVPETFPETMSAP